jgi:pimeloyl-ACP methyl ester carboxylesterase
VFKRSTPKIAGTSAVAELKKMIIGGLEQWFLIRGENTNNPILLLLHGGPGTAQIGFNRDYQLELEKHFIVVNWDQRGSGLSHSKRIPLESMNIDQFLHDSIEVVVFLKKEFQKEKIFLLGHSWGSILGMLAINKHPEHFYHYFGISQVVNMKKSEELSYELLLEEARNQKNDKAIEKLMEIGKPPWSNLNHDRIHQKYLDVLRGGISHDGKLVKDIAIKLLKSKEYNLFDVINYLKGQLFSVKTMLGELRKFEMENIIFKVEVPVTFIMGKYDLTVPHLPTQEFFHQLQAPSKEWIIFEESAHSPNYEEIDHFNSIILDRTSNYYSSSSIKGA